MSDQTPEPAADATQQQPPAQEAAEDTTDWKAEARKWESRAKENRDASTAQEQKLAAVLSALGIGDKQEDPAAAVERYKAEARAAQVEAAIVLNSGDADPKRLLDSVSFRESIKDIDPRDSAAIAAAIKLAVDANPALAKPTPGPAGWGDAVAGRTPQQHTTQDAQALTVLGF